MVDCIMLGPNKMGTKGDKLYNWLIEREDAEVAALITHPSQYKTIKELQPDLLISAGFSHIVPEEIIKIPEKGAINLHPSYLPYNRGTDPSQWSIINDDPVGVSVHLMAPEADMGQIIGRKEVPIYPDDDGRDVFHRLEYEQVELFKELWPSIRNGQIEPIEQDEDEGSINYSSDFKEITKLDLQEETTVDDLLDRLRALSFPPYKNAYFEQNGEKYYVELEITPESEAENPEGIHWEFPRYPEPKS